MDIFAGGRTCSMEIWMKW